MQKFQMLSAVAAAAALLGSAAYAAPPAFRGEATLATPAQGEKTVKISGVDWRCAGPDCVGEGARRSSIESIMKECRKVAAELGPLAAYQSRGRAMTKGNLAACNQAAKVQTAGTPTVAVN